MSTRADMSATLQDPDSRATRSTRNVSIALIGPHIGRRSVVAKAVSGAEGRTIREFAAYPDKVSELPRLLAQNFDVVMIDLDSDQNYALQLVQEIAATGTVNVIVYSSRNDPTLGMISTHAGASDFLPIPVDPTEENGPGPHHVPERVAPPRPVEVRPAPRVPEDDFLKDETERAWQQQPSAPKPIVQPSNGNHQNVTQVRAAAPAGVRAPEAAPRPAVLPEPRLVPPQASVQAPMKRPVQSSPVQNAVQRPVQGPIQNAVQRPVQSPTQNAVQRPVQDPVQSPVQSPVRSAIQSPVQNPIQRPAAPVQTPPPVPAPSVGQQSAPAVAPRTPGAIQTDADVLELFKYGKGQVKEIKDPDELPPSNSKKLVFISAGAVVVIAVVALLVFMRPSHQRTQVAPSTPQVASQPVTPAANTPTDTAPGTVPAAGQLIAKPSPAGPAGEIQNPDTPRPTRQVSSEMMDAQLAAQARISKDINKAAPGEEPPPAGMAPVSMDSGGGVKDAALAGFSKVSVVPVVSVVSAGVAEGMAIHKNAPLYPRIAKDSHVSGTVVLGATINRSGIIENVHVISGSQMLRGAAVDAVRTWRYRPYLLNNQPVAVQTTINVVFSLGKE